MLRQTGCAIAFCFLLTSAASAQVVRFETSVGEFDMVLNPTNNRRLDAHVQNMLHYVESKSYDGSWINRADEGFVLQMGGFYSHTKRPPATIESTRNFSPIAPVPGEPASSFNGLSNTVGTVAMALSGLSTGGTNQDSGTSSFFVNLTSNTFLDADFTVFAAISDMTVVNEIMALMKVDRTTDANFGAGSGNLAFSDVPLQDDGKQVFIKRAFLISDAMSVARANAAAASVMAESMAAGAAGGGAGSGSAAAGSGSAVVPEPASCLMFLVGLSGPIFLVRRRSRR